MTSFDLNQTVELEIPIDVTDKDGISVDIYEVEMAGGALEVTLQGTVVNTEQAALLDMLTDLEIYCVSDLTDYLDSSKDIVANVLALTPIEQLAILKAILNQDDKI